MAIGRRSGCRRQFGGICRGLAWFTVSVFACSPAFAETYAPPRAPDGKPDLGGVWAFDAFVPIERPDNVASVVINRAVYAASQASGAESLDVQTVKGKLRTALIVDPPDGMLPLRDRAAAMAWWEKYKVYLIGALYPEFTDEPDALPNCDRCLMANNAAAPPITSQSFNDA
jgi:hypothetical protein